MAAHPSGATYQLMTRKCTASFPANVWRLFAAQSTRSVLVELHLAMALTGSTLSRGAMRNTPGYEICDRLITFARIWRLLALWVIAERRTAPYSLWNRHVSLVKHRGQFLANAVSYSPGKAIHIPRVSQQLKGALNPVRACWSACASNCDESVPRIGECHKPPVFVYRVKR